VGTLRRDRSHPQQRGASMLEKFTWFRQSAYLYRADGANVYIDPWGLTVDDPADVVFITHAHSDHFEPEDLAKIVGGSTQIFAPQDVANELSGNVTPVQPGDDVQALDGAIKGTAVHAYNVAEERLEMHPKANKWVGYVLQLDGHSYYHAGDTDHVPELEEVKADVAMVPIGGTYTMDASEAAGLVKIMRPRIAVPMHYGFVVGSPSDAEKFRSEAAPVEVQLLQPTNPFERD
jgi:L-ascorbate metabolism protein UlaG (beta-lactamase superfamily)